MWIPGFGSDEVRPYKKSAMTEAHKQVRLYHFFGVLAGQGKLEKVGIYVVREKVSGKYYC